MINLTNRKITNEKLKLSRIFNSIQNRDLNISDLSLACNSDNCIKDAPNLLDILVRQPLKAPTQIKGYYQKTNDDVTWTLKLQIIIWNQH